MIRKPRNEIDAGYVRKIYAEDLEYLPQLLQKIREKMEAILKDEEMMKKILGNIR